MESSEIIRPEGLLGVFKIIAFVLGVIAFLIF